MRLHLNDPLEDNPEEEDTLPHEPPPGGAYNHHPSAQETITCPLLFPDRPTMSMAAQSLEPLAILDHLPFSYCCGEDGSSFNKVTIITSRSKTL